MYLYGTFAGPPDHLIDPNHPIIELEDHQVEFLGEGVKNTLREGIRNDQRHSACWAKHPWIATNKTLKKIVGCQTRREAREANNWMKSLVKEGMR